MAMLYYDINLQNLDWNKRIDMTFHKQVKHLIKWQHVLNFHYHLNGIQIIHLYLLMQFQKTNVEMILLGTEDNLDLVA